MKKKTEEEKKAKVNYSIDPIVRDKVIELAKVQGRNKSNMANKLLEDGIKQHEKKS